jgi:hypothetical protein
VDAHFRGCLIRSTLIDVFEMASLGHGNYVVVALYVGGSKASDLNLVLWREPRTGRTWFSSGSILPNEEHVDGAVRELF